MNRSWVKIAVSVVIVLVLIVGAKNFCTKAKDALDVEKMLEESERLADAQEKRLQAELDAAEAEAKRIEANKPSAPPGTELMGENIEQLQEDIQAQKLYQMALTEFKIARKPLMSYIRCVRYCRELIKKYPDNPETAKARVLLRKMPERHRSRYNITNEEMGL